MPGLTKQSGGILWVHMSNHSTTFLLQQIEERCGYEVELRYVTDSSEKTPLLVNAHGRFIGASTIIKHFKERVEQKSGEK